MFTMTINTHCSTQGVMTPSIPSAEVAMKLALVGESSFTLSYSGKFLRGAKFRVFHA